MNLQTEPVPSGLAFCETVDETESIQPAVSKKPDQEYAQMPSAAPIQSYTQATPSELSKVKSVRSSHVFVRPHDVYSLASARTDTSKQLIDLESLALSGGLAFYDTEQKLVDFEDATIIQSPSPYVPDHIVNAGSIRSTDVSYWSHPSSDRLTKASTEMESVVIAPSPEELDNWIRKSEPKLQRKSSDKLSSVMTRSSSSVRTGPAVETNQDIYRVTRKDLVSSVTDQPSIHADQLLLTTVPVSRDFVRGHQSKLFPRTSSARENLPTQSDRLFPTDKTQDGISELTDRLSSRHRDPGSFNTSRDAALLDDEPQQRFSGEPSISYPSDPVKVLPEIQIDQDVYRGIPGDQKSSLAEQSSVSCQRLLQSGYQSFPVHNMTSGHTDLFVAKSNTLGLVHQDYPGRDDENDQLEKASQPYQAKTTAHAADQIWGHKVDQTLEVPKWTYPPVDKLSLVSKDLVNNADTIQNSPHDPAGAQRMAPVDVEEPSEIIPPKQSSMLKAIPSAERQIIEDGTKHANQWSNIISRNRFSIGYRRPDCIKRQTKRAELINRTTVNNRTKNGPTNGQTTSRSSVKVHLRIALDASHCSPKMRDQH
ncbi:hypothetical protein D915_009305 [Fasciola hepatica]|uniref:Uncharacterized protein n=1 Tax=Fasciola hepatica TaxID=6192 RepID=A0A4E0QYA9_FASHE|nr:hypothetical protein D915_009305 [Fasciola hepatica]